MFKFFTLGTIGVIAGWVFWPSIGPRVRETMPSATVTVSTSAQPPVATPPSPPSRLQITDRKTFPGRDSNGNLGWGAYIVKDTKTGNEFLIVTTGDYPNSMIPLAP